MNARERLLATFDFEPIDRPLFWEFGYWVPTLRRWYAKGLPRKTGIPDSLDDGGTLMGECLGIDWRYPHYDHDVHAALGFDEFMHRIPVNNLFCPPFESRILEDHKDWYIASDSDGQIVKISRQNGSRQHLDTCVK